MSTFNSPLFHFEISNRVRAHFQPPTVEAIQTIPKQLFKFVWDFATNWNFIKPAAHILNGISWRSKKSQ